MIIEAIATKDFRAAFDVLQAKKKKIVKEKICLLANDPRHPSLNAHRIYRARTTKSIWECYIDEGMRLLYEIEKGILYLWQLGAHKIVDDVHLHRFATTDFLTWNIEITAPIAPPLKLEKPALDSYYSDELFLETQDTPEIISYNYFAHYPFISLLALGVPQELIKLVQEAHSLEDVLALPELPENVRLSLIDLSTSPELEAVLFDPSLLLYRTTLDRLEGYFEGKIKKLMLNLLPEQQQYVDIEKAPLILLKGVAGSGKTTIGIYRAIRLASQGRRVLMIAFNTTLSSVTQSLVEELIGSPLPKNLRIRTLYSVMTEILRMRGVHLNVPNGNEVYRKVIGECLRNALLQVRMKNNQANVLKQDEKFFEEEIRRVIKGLGLKSIAEYKEVKRYGRKTALGSTQREAVWDIYEAYQQQLAQTKVNDWADVGLLALRSLHEQPLIDSYDDIIVDEAQDLAPIDLRVIQLLIASSTRISFRAISSIIILGDAAQTLYSRGFSWEQAGIQARGRTAILRKNHRNTRQIGEAANHLLQNNTLGRASDEYIDPEWIQRQGTAPKLLRADYSSTPDGRRLNQIALVRDSVLDLVGRRVFRLSDFAVLCPTNYFCKMCQQELTESGLHAARHNDIDFDILEEQIKVLTFHSAKGLEFPAVFLLGLTEDDLPATYRLQSLEEEEKQLEIENQRRLCYVGMTRAAEELYLVTVEGNESRFIKELAGKIAVNSKRPVNSE